MEKLILKYDRPGPRYTSYPPVPFWKGGVNEATWMEHLSGYLGPDEGVDLYLHIPYCEKLCWYCGCHRVISKDHSKATPYIQSLKNEWDHYSSKFPFIKIQSLHLGGGTPTFLPAAELDDLLSYFPKVEKNFVGAIEVDPRTCHVDQLAVLRKHGFSRLSMGIQDFDDRVQSLINRHQSIELVENLVQKVREFGFTSLNFDLIYGLPGQSLSTVEKTIEEVIRLSPDCIAFYSYAHLPDKLKNQRLIKDSDLPLPTLKRALYERGRELLLSNGYREIGMDHFAKFDSFLSESRQEKKLKRTFMGYTDHKATVLLGLGASSISQTPTAYAQNEKDIKKYLEDSQNGELPIIHGHFLTHDETNTAANIQDLMCHGEVSLDYFDDKSLIFEMESDGLLVVNRVQNKIELTSVGMAFVRNVAMAIDPMIKQAHQNQFSRTI